MITPETTLQRQSTLQSVKALNLEVTVTKGQELDPGKLGHFRSPLAFNYYTYRLAVMLKMYMLMICFEKLLR